MGSSSSFDFRDETQLSGSTENVYLLLGLHLWTLARTDQVGVGA